MSFTYVGYNVGIRIRMHTCVPVWMHARWLHVFTGARECVRACKTPVCITMCQGLLALVDAGVVNVVDGGGRTSLCVCMCVCVCVDLCMKHA